jgi:hypothetical protein
MQSVATCKKRQKTSEADSFRNMKVKISYTLEDGHVGRNMWCKTVAAKYKTVTTIIYNKAARRRQHNLQNPLNNTVQQDAKI